MGQHLFLFVEQFFVKCPFLSHTKHLSCGFSLLLNLPPLKCVVLKAIATSFFFSFLFLVYSVRGSSSDVRFSRVFSPFGVDNFGSRNRFRFRKLSPCFWYTTFSGSRNRRGLEPVSVPGSGRFKKRLCFRVQKPDLVLRA